jgi:hypothetical protein
VNDTQKQRIMDSLTQDQRKGVAAIIRSASAEGDYTGMDEDGGSFWEEDASETLSCLAAYFERYDPASVLD